MKNQRNISEKNDWTSMWVRRTLVCALIFALTVTLAPVQTLAQTVGQQKNLADLLPETAVYPVRDCTVTYDTILQEDSSAAVRIEITNHGEQAVSQWQLRFYYPYIINLSGDIQITSHENGYYTYIPQQSLREIPSGQTINFSFTVSGPAIPEPPEIVELVINGEQFAPLPTARPLLTATPAVQTAKPAETPASTATSTVGVLSVRSTASPAQQTASPVQQTASVSVTASQSPAGTSAETPVAPMAIPGHTPETSTEYETSATQSIAVESRQPTTQPIVEPTATPDTQPSIELSATPDVEPSAIPDTQPTATPKPSGIAVSSGTPEPSVTPLSSPTATTQPTTEPTPQPEETAEPTAEPTVEPAQDLYIYTDTTISEDITCGNLFLMGGSLNINGHTVTVQGDYFQNGGNCTLGATQLTVSGTLRATSGTLNIRRQVKAEIQGDLHIEGNAKLIMDDYVSYPELTVHGDLIINSAEQSRLEYGTLTLGGSFLQTENDQIENLYIGGRLTLALNGTEIQTIDLPGLEKIDYLDLRHSKAVRLESEISGYTLDGIEKLICPDGTLYVDFDSANTSSSGTIRGNLKCFGNLNIDGHALTVQGKYTQYGGTSIASGGTLTTTGDFTADKGRTDIREGLIQVKGTAHIKKNATINMKESDRCRFLTEGDYISASRTTDRWNDNEGGILEVKGNLIRRDTATTFGLNLENTTVLFSGKDAQKVQIPDFQSFGYAACIDLRQSKEVDFGGAALHARQIIGFSHIRVGGELTLYDSRVTLLQDETFEGNITLNDSYLNLNGHLFHIREHGNLEQRGGLINLNGGKLHVGGNYRMTGGSILQMIRHSDLLQVKGGFDTASTMSHSDMLRDGRMELWGNFNQSGDEVSFGSSGNFTIAFLGSDQRVHFDDTVNSGFANVDPEHGSFTTDDDSIIFAATLSYHLSKGFLEGLSDALALSELNGVTVAIATAIGISIGAIMAISPAGIAAAIGTLVGILITLSSAFMIAKAAGGIYSTATGNATAYAKAEAFAHDTALILVGIVFLNDGISILATTIPSLCKCAAEGIAKAISRIKPSEVIQSIKSADRITSFEDFLAYAKNFLEDEALQYIRTALNGEADDIVRLKDIANLLEEASESIGKNLSKAELEAGLEALWREGGVGGALAAIESVFKGDDFASVWDAIVSNAENIEGTEIPATFQMKLSAKINYVNPETGTNVLWANANATEHMGEYISRIEGTSQNVGVRSQVILESFQAAVNKAMEELILNPLGRYDKIYGNWQLGINTRTGVIVHARMIY